MKQGYRPYPSDALHAKCCDCMCNYADGRKDCQHTNCPLYAKHKYRTLEPNLNWVFDSLWGRHDIKYKEERLTKEEYIEKYIYNESKIIASSQLFRAKCFSCYNEFRSGREDCMVRGCPIYYWMPYRELLPTYEWMFELDYTNRHRNRALNEGLYRKAKIDGYSTIRFNINSYVKTYLTWTGPPPVKRVRKAATRQAT